MKETLEPLSAEQADQEGFANRKLIRPSLNRNDHPPNNGRNHVPNHGSGERRDRDRSAAAGKKTAPTEQTNAENFYYIKQMQSRTPMVVVLDAGEKIHGVIEWYDKNCIKVHRANEPNLLVMKSCIRYMYKENDVRDGGNGIPEHQPDME